MEHQEMGEKMEPWKGGLSQHLWRGPSRHPPLSLGPSNPLEGPVPVSGASLLSNHVEDDPGEGRRQEDPRVSILREGGREEGGPVAPSPISRVSIPVEEAGSSGGRPSIQLEVSKSQGRKRGRPRKEEKCIPCDDRKKARRQLTIKDMLKSASISSRMKDPGCDRVKSRNQAFPGVNTGGTMLQNSEVLDRN